jgi:cytochrome P450
MTATAPGPGVGVLLQLRELRSDPLGFMQRHHASYGDIVRLGAGKMTVHLLGHPDYADHVLRARHTNYDRETRSARSVRVVTGESLITNSGETWRKHRLLMQPAFQRDSVRDIAPMIVEETNELFSSWHEGRELDLAAEMMHLTFSIAARAFFGADVDAESRALEALLPIIFEESFRRSTAVVPVPASVDRLLRRERTERFDAALQTLDDVVRKVIAHGGEGGMVATLLATRNSDGTPRLSDDEIRNETIALLLAGHETTANALAWTFHLLMQHPEVSARLADEVQRISGPLDSAETTEELPYTSAVLQEALRLYPPIWIVERRAIEDDEIGGYEIPAGSIVYVSPYVLHRHRDFWSDPDHFDPARFLDGAKKKSFLPFGAGPHHCIGSHFAMLEARIILAMFFRRFTLSGARGDIEPEAWITLRPRGGVPAKVGFLPGNDRAYSS